ncbi:PREDICTED: neutrophil defensin 4-like [Propithecus coquereli]|uniref:neutrophil defensin 4-like n=1 Tax=Propithecus coquereli TaxID=379532 RepID=UPI00063F12FD|nr:PREDICTED: neutrophil defensin 4-like [Propithecus coquereli]
MRTLVLLAALLLLALQAQAGPLRERAEDAPAQEQPRAEDQDMAISFAGDKISAIRVAGSIRDLSCSCRRRRCRFPETVSGTCLSDGDQYPFCCR